MTYRMKFLSLLTALVFLGALGCASIERQTGISTEAQTGAAVGGAAGGLISAAAGASTGWIIAATVLGVVAGGLIGDYLTEEDKAMAGETTHDTLENQPTGETSTWRNPDTGNSGTVSVTDTYDTADRTPCRAFTQTITADGRTESGEGTACRAADGTWQVEP